MSLFNRAKALTPGKMISLNLHEGGFELDGQTLSFPAELEELKKVLGEPRVEPIEYTDLVRKGLCEDYGFSVEDFKPSRYYWDDYGIVAGSYDQKIIHDMVIFFGASKYPLPTTTCSFAGELKLDGKPWQQIVLNKDFNGSYSFGSSWVHASVYGNKTKEANVKVFEWALKSQAKEELKLRIRQNNGK